MTVSFRGNLASDQSVPHRDLTNSVLFGDVKKKRATIYNSTTGQVSVRVKESSEFLVSLAITFDEIPEGMIRILLYKNGSELYRVQKNYSSLTAQPETLELSRIIDLSNGEYVEVKVWNDSVSPQSLLAMSATNVTSLDLIKI